MYFLESTTADPTGCEVVASRVSQLAPLASRIEQSFESGIAIYGAGFLGAWAVQFLRSNGASVSFFIDRDPLKWGSSISGVPVVSPTDPRVSSAQTVVIAARHAVPEVIRSMHNSERLLISFDAYYVVRNFQRLSTVRDTYLEDQRSVSTFNAILMAMLTGSVESCRTVMEKDMYFALPEFCGTFEEIFVDAGAFVGDTIERFIWENLGTFKHIYAFEPGSRQYFSLQKRMDRLADEWAFDLDRISLVNAGLSSSDGLMSCTFLYDHPIRHGLAPYDPGEISSDINDACKVYSLDSYLCGKPVTFIKADIEGMEMDFLAGARNTIIAYKPKMALCVYHYPSHLFEIAEYIRSIVPDYKFFLRHHAPIFGDSVLYCHAT